jgi:hypothetical protein
MRINYQKFIEENFYLRNKDGELIRFCLNDVQSGYLKQLQTDYPEMVGLRENDLKGRQFGMSTFIAALFTTDFILSSQGIIQLTDSDIYSHKDKETASHFGRVNMFLDSWLLADQGGDYGDRAHHVEISRLRKHFLKVDNQNGLLISHNNTNIQTATAGAKVSGRGSTKQNILWSEVAFYNNTSILSAENLVTGAEEQVPFGRGKIFRETTGNLAADYFAKEYKAGKEGLSDFRSRFFAWYLHKEYSMAAPVGWDIPDYYMVLLSKSLATTDQCYWHYIKTRKLTNKKRLREYPTYDTEAFLYGGNPFFDADALLKYTGMVKKPLKTSMFASAL